MNETKRNIQSYILKNSRKSQKNNKKRFYYLINLQFLGFRFSGWQKQSNSKTIQEMFDKTLCFILGHDNFKTLGCGRTDAMVSANDFLCELFIYEQLDTKDLKTNLKRNLPADIKVLDVKEVDESFEIISKSKVKEYSYFFSASEEAFPLAAPFMVNFKYGLDIEIMKKGAELFLGKHNFKSYCYRPNPDGEFIREIILSEIVVNDIYTANFFPEKSYVFRVSSKGFMRHQVRLMIGALVRLGLYEITLDDLSQSLVLGDNKMIGFVAPASGLFLNKVEFLS